MVNAKQLSIISLVSLMACLSGQAALSMGAKHVAPAQFQEFKLIPRVNLWGFSGDYTRGEGQAMVPILGDANRAFYFLAEGNKVVNASDWMGGVGLGYRQVVGGNIFGGYLTGNYQNSSENNDFYIANPGLEMLGQEWDADINGYLPFKQKKSMEFREGIASIDFGINSYERFTGHKAFDHELTVINGEEAGRGIDGEIGRIIPRIENLRVYVGGYYFNFDDANSTGGFKARAIYEFNRYFALEGRYTYDNVQHSQGVLGLRIAFGGYSVDEKKKYGIATRLLDPIERNLLISNIDLNKIQHNIDRGEVPIHDNVQFFRQLPSSASGIAKGNDIGPQQGDGTFENPYVGFTPANVAGIPETLGPIDKHPLLFFAPGNYNFEGFSVTKLINNVPVTVDNRFNLPNGWGMFGRSEGYKTPSAGDNRALFTGGLDLIYDSGKGTDVTTLDSIRVNNSNGGGFGAVFSASNFINAQNVVLQNVDIQNNVTPVQALTVYGISIEDSSVSMDNSSITASSIFGNVVTLDAGVIATGVFIDNSTFNIGNGNSISVTATAGNASASTGQVRATVTTTGILVNTASTINFGNNNNLTSIANGGTANFTGSGSANASAVSYGILVNSTNSTSTINIGNNNNFLTTANGGIATATGSDSSARAVSNSLDYAMLLVSTTLNINGSNNNFSATANAGTAINPRSVSAIGTANGIYSTIYSTITDSHQINIGMNSNNNSFFSTARGTGSGPNNYGAAYGITLGAYTGELKLNISSSSTTTIVVSGSGGASSSSLGIYLMSFPDLLQIDGTTVSNINVFNNNGLINFIRPQEGIGGYKIRWLGVGTLPWI